MAIEFKTDDDKVKHLTKLFDSLVEIRRPYEPMVDEVIKFVNHGRRKITDKTARKGQKTGIDIYDGTALSAANLAADGIYGYFCSPSIHWFDFTLPGKINFARTSGMRGYDNKRLDEIPEVKVWLDDCEEVQYSAFLRSNFYDFMPGYIHDGITIGTPTCIIEEEDIKSGRILFTLPHFRECYIAENKDGRVDTLFRQYSVTIRQLVQKFGEEVIFGLTADMKPQYEKNPYADKEIIHAIIPRSDYNPGKLDGKNKPIASFWLLCDGPTKLIKESGYDDQSFVTWRWRKNSDELYARTPAWDAYVDIALANQQGRSNLIAGHKMVEPPMAAPEDIRGKFMNSPNGVTWIPGGITRDKIPVPIMTGIQLPYGEAQQERSDRAIREHFHVDFFLMLYQAAFQKVELTATQVLGMQSEQAAILGARIGRLSSEGGNPIMDRVFNIEQRAGRMPPPPDVLMEVAAGQPIEIDYMGPLSQAQKKLFKVQGIRAGMELASGIANVSPPALDYVDADKAMVEALDAAGFPAVCIRGDTAVDTIRKIRQQQEQEARQIAATKELASIAQKTNKKIEEGSLLDKFNSQLSEQVEEG